MKLTGVTVPAFIVGDRTVQVELDLYKEYRPQVFALSGDGSSRLLQLIFFLLAGYEVADRGYQIKERKAYVENAIRHCIPQNASGEVVKLRLHDGKGERELTFSKESGGWDLNLTGGSVDDLWQKVLLMTHSFNWLICLNPIYPYNRGDRFGVIEAAKDVFGYGLREYEDNLPYIYNRVDSGVSKSVGVVEEVGYWKDSIVLLDSLEAFMDGDRQVSTVNELIDNADRNGNQFLISTTSYDICQPLTPRHVLDIGFD